MLRSVQIREAIALDASTLTVAAKCASAPLRIVVGTDATEHLCVTFTCLDVEDRRDAALLGLEQLAGRHLRVVGANRRVVLSDKEGRLSDDPQSIVALH